jgi:hypothetical protein
MTFVISTEVLINQNSRMKLLNHYRAESGSEEARERIKEFLAASQLSISDTNKVLYLVADPSINPTAGDATSNPYFDPAYSASLTATVLSSGLGSIGFAWVKVWPKTEQRAGYSLTNTSPTDFPVFYGYHRTQPDAQLTQYVNSGTNISNYTGSPVYLVTALSQTSDGYRQMIGTDIASVPVPPLNAAVFSKDPIEILGPAVTVNGNDQFTASPKDLNGLESADSISGDLTAVTGTPLPDRPLSPYSYNISGLIKSLRPPFAKEIQQVAPSVTKLTDGTYVGSGVDLGKVPSSGDISQTTYVDGPLHISDSTGQGILVVNGDLSVSGTFTYYGLIIVKGRIYFNGSGTGGITIEGAIIASSVSGTTPSLLEGTVQIVNNSAVIQKQFAALQYARLVFREL